jgi:hypothetical protein
VLAPIPDVISFPASTHLALVIVMVAFGDGSMHLAFVGSVA